MSVSSTKSGPAPPAPFTITDTTQLEDWKKWQRSWRFYANAINLDQKSHDFQLSTFKSLVGPDALEIYNTFSILDITDVESVIRKFDEHFKPKFNVTLERYKLYKLSQKSGQRFEDYLTDVTNQVEKCEFRSIRDEIILYKIVGGIDNDEVREALLCYADLKYDKAIEICRASSAMHFMSEKENVSHPDSVVMKEERPRLKTSKGRKSLLKKRTKKSVDVSEVKAKRTKIKRRREVQKVTKTELKELLSQKSSVQETRKARTSVKAPFEEPISSTGDAEPEKANAETSSPAVVESVGVEDTSEPPAPAENIKSEVRNEDGGSDGDWGGDDFHDDDDDNDPDYVVETPVEAVMKGPSAKKEPLASSEPSETPAKPKTFSCEVCEKEFSSKYGLERHRGIHTGAHAEKGSCFYCGKEFKKRYIRRHMVKSHPHFIGCAGPKVYSCDKCDFKTTFKTNIRRHQYQHTDEKPLACELCEYKCITPRLMKAHVAKLHTGERPYSCPQCNRGFLQLDAMKRHLVTHLTPEERALHLLRIADNTTCETCGKIFSTRGALKTHSIVHTGEKPYACNVCDYRSVNKSGLSSHMMKHSDEKPFVCTVCGYSCKLKQTLAGHMNIHTGDRPYACKLCDSKFKQYPHLKRHMLVHTGEKPYVCDICGHRWTTQSNLKQHMKVHLNHTGDPSQYTPPRKRQKKPKVVIVMPPNQPELQPPPAPPVPPAPANAIPQWSEQVSTINPIECFQSLETPPPFHPTYPVHQGNPRPPDCRYFQQRQWPNPN